MKADPSGTASEQAFARMGWVPVKEANIQRPCIACAYFSSVSYTTRAGGCGSAARCFHPWTYGNPGKGQATKEAASCAKWEWTEARRA